MALPLAMPAHSGTNTSKTLPPREDMVKTGEALPLLRYLGHWDHMDPYAHVSPGLYTGALDGAKRILNPLYRGSLRDLHPATLDGWLFECRDHGNHVGFGPKAKLTGEIMECGCAITDGSSGSYIDVDIITRGRPADSKKRYAAATEPGLSVKTMKWLLTEQKRQFERGKYGNVLIVSDTVEPKWHHKEIVEMNAIDAVSAMHLPDSTENSFSVLVISSQVKDKRAYLASMKMPNKASFVVTTDHAALTGARCPTYSCPFVSEIGEPCRPHPGLSAAVWLAGSDWDPVGDDSKVKPAVMVVPEDEIRKYDWPRGIIPHPAGKPWTGDFASFMFTGKPTGELKAGTLQARARNIAVIAPESYEDKSVLLNVLKAFSRGLSVPPESILVTAAALDRVPNAPIDTRFSIRPRALLWTAIKQNERSAQAAYEGRKDRATRAMTMIVVVMPKGQHPPKGGLATLTDVQGEFREYIYYLDPYTRALYDAEGNPHVDQNKVWSYKIQERVLSAWH